MPFSAAVYKLKRQRLRFQKACAVAQSRHYYGGVGVVKHTGEVIAVFVIDVGQLIGVLDILDDDSVVGISLHDCADREAILSKAAELNDLISKNMKNFRRFKLDKIVE